MGCHLRNPQVYCFSIFPVSSDTTDVPLAFSRVASHTDLQISSSFLWMYHFLLHYHWTPSQQHCSPHLNEAPFSTGISSLGHIPAFPYWDIWQLLSTPLGAVSNGHITNQKDIHMQKNVALNREQDTCLWSESCNRKAECPLVGPQLSTSSDKILCSFYMCLLLSPVLFLGLQINVSK